MRRLVQISLLALIGLFLHGIIISILFGVGTIYAKSIGLSTFQTSMFMASATVGILCLQYPIGVFSDRFDRRIVILWINISASIFAFWLSILGDTEFFLILSLMALFGGTSLTLYSLFIAHANDYLTPSQMVSTSSSLVMVNGFGAVIGAPLVAVSMDLFGDWAYSSLIAFIH